VDKVWAPLESMYAADKKPIPGWDQGLPTDEVPEKATELFLPDDYNARVV
jgi:hypothetical protein